MANSVLSCPICGGKVKKIIINPKWLAGYYRCQGCDKRYGEYEGTLQEAMKEYIKECKLNDYKGIDYPLQTKEKQTII